MIRIDVGIIIPAVDIYSFHNRNLAYLRIESGQQPNFEHLLLIIQNK